MAVMACGIASSEAVTVFISNVSNGPAAGMTPGDTLWALNDNTVMTSGSITIGYFTATTTVGDIDTITELVSKLGSDFTVIGTIGINSTSPTFMAAVPGYAEGVGNGYSTSLILPTAMAPFTNPLVGRIIYQIATDATDVTSAGLTNQFALFNVGTIAGDDSGHQQVTATSPALAAQVFIGGNGTFTGDAIFGGGEGDYSTLKLAVIPEPSTALLGALGALALLRRRRN